MEFLRHEIFFSFIILIFSVQVTELPHSGVSPDRMTRTSSILLPTSSQILTFGGRIASSGTLSNSIFSYSIPENKWSEITPKSSFRPPAMYNTKLFIQSSKYLIVLFGTSSDEISSNVYKFDLNLLVWSIISISGNFRLGLDDSASCIFEYNGTEYLALYGGNSIEGGQEGFYLY